MQRTGSQTLIIDKGFQFVRRFSLDDPPGDIIRKSLPAQRRKIAVSKLVSTIATPRPNTAAPTVGDRRSPIRIGFLFHQVSNDRIHDVARYPFQGQLIANDV